MGGQARSAVERWHALVEASVERLMCLLNDKLGRLPVGKALPKVDGACLGCELGKFSPHRWTIGADEPRGWHATLCRNLCMLIHHVNLVSSDTKRGERRRRARIRPSDVEHARGIEATSSLLQRQRAVRRKRSQHEVLRSAKAPGSFLEETMSSSACNVRRIRIL